MKTITVYPQDIIPNAKYMCDAQGRCDLLGQILINGYGIRIPPKTRTPQCLQSSIVNFVTCIRQYVYCNTPLTQSLLALSPLSPRKQIAEANLLLNPLNITLVTEEQLTKVQQTIEPVVEPTKRSLVMTSVFRTCRYTCTCGGTQSVNDLVSDTDDDTLLLYCNYCNDEVPKQYVSEILRAFPIINESSFTN